MKKNLPIIFAVLITFAFPFCAYSQTIKTVAGVGTEGYTGDKESALGAALDWPTSVAIDRRGNLYIADENNNIVRKVSNGIITTFAGNGFRAGTGYGAFSGDGGPATAASLFHPFGVAVDTVGRLFIADEGNNCIREVDTSGVITTVAGTGGAGNFGYSGDGGLAVAAQLNGPTHVAVDTFGNIYIADFWNSCIREVMGGNITTIAGTGVTGYGGDGGPANAAQLSNANDVAVDFAGNVYIADMYNNLIRKIDLTGTINIIAGTGISGYSGDGGPATDAYLFQPSGIAVDDSGNVYFSDLGNSCVRKINAHDTITTIAGVDTAGYDGDGRPAATARLSNPEGLAAVGYNVYIADRGNFRVREVVPGSSLLAVSNTNTEKESIELYPNPGTGSFTIIVSTAFDEDARVIITNNAGQQLNDIDARTNTPLAIALDQPPGIYFVSVITSHGVLSEKLIVIPY